MSEKERAKIVELYTRHNVSIPNLQKRFRRSPNVITRVLRDANVPSRTTQWF